MLLYYVTNSNSIAHLRKKIFRVRIVLEHTDLLLCQPIELFRKKKVYYFKYSTSITAKNFKCSTYYCQERITVENFILE